MTDKISIIVPVYNVEHYLKRCLNSILQQTYSNLEIILIDDGSTDNSGKICEQYKKKDRRIIAVHKENGGLSSARNAGIKLATGDYIGFVDSDDWISKQMYETLYHLCKRGDIGIAVCGIKRVVKPEEEEKKENKITIYSQEKYLKKFFRVYTQDSNHFACNKLYRASIMKQIRYPEGLIDEDVEGTFLALLRTKHIISTERILYYYRDNPNSITNQLFSLKQFDLRTVWGRVYKIALKKCNEEMQYYAKINWYRADFGLLCKMAVTEYEITEKQKIKKLQNKILKRLKKHIWSLLQGPIPLNRKVILIMFCINYPVSKKILQLGVKVKKIGRLNIK